MIASISALSAAYLASFRLRNWAANTLSGPRSRGEQVHVSELVLARAEVLHLHRALFNQRLEAVVDTTDAQTQVLGQLVLRQVEVLLEHAKDRETRVLLKARLPALHPTGFCTKLNKQVEMYSERSPGARRRGAPNVLNAARAALWARAAKAREAVQSQRCRVKGSLKPLR